jgi:predicted nucleic acid-binding protein
VIFVDTNILSDFLANDPVWGLRARAALRDALLQGPVVSNHVVLAELYAKRDATQAIAPLLDSIGLVWMDFDRQAAWHASVAHGRYRQKGGEREVILADFLIGGHALALGASLLTRDSRRFQSYFPNLKLISPETHP